MNCPKCHQPMKTAVMDGRPAWYCHNCGEVLFRQTTGLMDNRPADGREPLVAQMTPPPPKSAVRGTGTAGGVGSGRRGNKFGAVPDVVDGIRFDSKREAERYLELVMLEAAKKISNLRTKCPACVFDLTVNGVKVSRFTADFVYTQDGRRVVEDLKSGPTKTRAYVMRRKLMKACHGIEILETE